MPILDKNVRAEDLTSLIELGQRMPGIPEALRLLEYINTCEAVLNAASVVPEYPTTLSNQTC